MNEKIVLTGSPMSTQHIYGQRWRIRYMKKKAKDLKDKYILEVQQQRRWKKCIETPVVIDVKIYFWDKRKRDWDNYHKLAIDSLEWIVIQDDVLILKATVEKLYDKGCPRYEITISDYVK